MSWLCPKCKLTNFAGNISCADSKCKYPRPNLTQDEIDIDWLRLTGFTENGWKERGKQRMAVTQTEVDKFTMFFNKGCASANSTATIEELDLKIKELEDICLEGKATLQGYQKVRRERVDKLSKSERDKLITDSHLDITGSDRLIKARTERMSKADKLKQSLAGLDLDDDVVKALMSNVKVNENMQAISNDASKSTFNKQTPAVISETVTLTVEQVEEKIEKIEKIEKKDEPDFLKGLF